MSASISIVVPAYNEERRLPPSLERIAEYLLASDFGPAEVLVVNDGSTDDTGGVVRAAAERWAGRDIRIQLLDNPGNRGKGYSVRHGMLAANHEWVLFTDADLSAPIEELDKLMAAVASGDYAGAIGSRAINRKLIGKRQPLFREMSGRLFNLAVRLVAGLPFKDTQCGFKMFRREAAQEIFRRQRQERFGFDVEILYIAHKLGYKIAETPVRWDDVEGSSVGLLSGADAFLDIARVRWHDLRGRYR